MLDPHDRPTVTRDAYPAIAHFVEALGSWRDGDGKGRWRAITHSHMHRYTVQCPSFTVHNDYTHADQGPKQVAKVIDGHEASAESAKQLPFFAVNVWTALARVQRDALAVCRWHRGRQLTDMGYADQRYDQDEWYFVPEMCRGEAIVFKQFDSAATTTEVEDTEGRLKGHLIKGRSKHLNAPLYTTRALCVRHSRSIRVSVSPTRGVSPPAVRSSTGCSSSWTRRACCLMTSVEVQWRRSRPMLPWQRRHAGHAGPRELRLQACVRTPPDDDAGMRRRAPARRNQPRRPLSLISYSSQ